MNKFKKTAAAGLVMAAAATGAATVAAPEASAAVTGGKYSWRVNGMMSTVTPAAVRGRTLTSYGPLGPQRFHITQTRYGGYVDASYVRYVFIKKGRGYRGTVYSMGIPVGQTWLTPRR